MPLHIPNPNPDSDECTTPTTRCYNCINQAIEAYESIQIDSSLLNVQGVSPTTGLGTGEEVFYDQFCSPVATSVIINALQHQRAALTSCKALMVCTQCNAQSSYVMFAISVCGALLELIEHLQLLISLSLSDSSRRGSTKQACSTVPTGHGHYWASENGDVLRSCEQQQEQQERRYGVQIGHWMLGEDDEKHVLQGLMHARVSSLGTLIEEVDRIVEKNRWLAHESAIRRVRERYRLSLGCAR